MKVLVLCTGNRWRSPLIAHLLQQARPSWEVRSAGTRARDAGKNVPPAWRRCIEGWTEPHVAKKVTPEDVAWADIVVGVQQSHYQTGHPRMIIFRVPDPAFIQVHLWPMLAKRIQERIPELLTLIEVD